MEKKDGMVTKLRFLLFPQKCFLRKTNEVLDFVLHSVVSITSVQLCVVIMLCFTDWEAN